MGKCKRHEGSADHEVLVMEFPHQIRPGWPKSSQSMDTNRRVAGPTLA
jgi:hypothetical protein